MSKYRNTVYYDFKSRFIAIFSSNYWHRLVLKIPFPDHIFSKISKYRTESSHFLSTGKYYTKTPLLQVFNLHIYIYIYIYVYIYIFIYIYIYIICHIDRFSNRFLYRTTMLNVYHMHHDVPNFIYSIPDFFFNFKCLF